MAYYTEEQIKAARSIDLLTYLQRYEPNELVQQRGNIFTTRTHDSLKINPDGRWMWWSRGIGGTTALDYLVKVKDMPFTEAMKILTEGDFTTAKNIEHRPEPVPMPKRELILPERCDTTYEVESYLAGRGIDREIINECIREGLLYESLPYHNCVFVGYNEEGKASFACYRATNGKRVLRDVSGSDKCYSFRLEGSGNKLHVFESAIDLLSYATLKKMNRANWRTDPMLSLGGIYAPGQGNKTMKMPSALNNALNRNPKIKTIYLHLDNDDAGRIASKAIAERLADRYIVIDDPPPIGKDCNDYLMQHRRHQQERRSHHRTQRDYCVSR